MGCWKEDLLDLVTWISLACWRRVHSTCSGGWCLPEHQDLIFMVICLVPSHVWVTGAWYRRLLGHQRCFQYIRKPSGWVLATWCCKWGWPQYYPGSTSGVWNGDGVSWIALGQCVMGWAVQEWTKGRTMGCAITGVLAAVPAGRVAEAVASTMLALAFRRECSHLGMKSDCWSVTVFSACRVQWVKWLEPPHA